MKNNYFILRHGEALSNKEHFISSFPEKRPSPLTEKGKKQSLKVAEKLKEKNIDLIFSSDLQRCSKTAEIVGEKLGIKPKYDKRLREYDIGIFNGEPIEKLVNFFKEEKERFEIRPPQGENYKELIERMYDFIESIEKEHSDKNILIVSHQANLTLLEGKARGLTGEETLEEISPEKRVKKAEIRKLEFRT